MLTVGFFLSCLVRGRFRVKRTLGDKFMYIPLTRPRGSVILRSVLYSIRNTLYGCVCVGNLLSVRELASERGMQRPRWSLLKVVLQ